MRRVPLNIQDYTFGSDSTGRALTVGIGIASCIKPSLSLSLFLPSLFLSLSLSLLASICPEELGAAVVSTESSAFLSNRKFLPSESTFIVRGEFSKRFLALEQAGQTVFFEKAHRRISCWNFPNNTTFYLQLHTHIYISTHTDTRILFIYLYIKQKLRRKRFTLKT